MKRETLGGIWTLLRPLSNSSFSYFLLHLLKNSKHVRIKYSQNHFKSTFGSAYLNSKKTKLKLAKQVKKKPRKASFPWDLGLMFVQPIKYEINNKINYTTLQIRSILVWKEMSEKQQKEHRRKSPRGDGEWARKSLFKE